MRIKLNRKFLYSVQNAKEVMEEHYKDTYLDIGYKGQICLLSITQEFYCKILTGANMIWRSII